MYFILSPKKEIVGTIEDWAVNNTKIEELLNLEYYTLVPDYEIESKIKTN